jgi:hypothetical protein
MSFPVGETWLHLFSSYHVISVLYFPFLMNVPFRASEIDKSHWLVSRQHHFASSPKFMIAEHVLGKCIGRRHSAVISVCVTIVLPHMS